MYKMPLVGHDVYVVMINRDKGDIHCQQRITVLNNSRL